MSVRVKHGIRARKRRIPNEGDLCIFDSLIRATCAVTFRWLALTYEHFAQRESCVEPKDLPDVGQIGFGDFRAKFSKPTSRRIA